jgi:hypothetical protein
MFPREFALSASPILSAVKSFALVEILGCLRLRLALRGGEGLAKRFTLFCSAAESNLPLFFIIIWENKKRREAELVAYNCALGYIPRSVETRTQYERVCRGGRNVVLALATAGVDVSGYSAV